MTDQACENTDRELWREVEADYYAPSLHVTKEGGVGINVGGIVHVKPLRAWHALANQATPVDHKNMPKAEESMPKDERVKVAYESFRNGFRYNPPEDWDSASNLVRDVARVGYAQGTVDAMGAITPLQALNVILTKIDFDGLDPDTFTVAELRRAIP